MAEKKPGPRVVLKVWLKGGRMVTRDYDPEAAGLRLGWIARMPEFVRAEVVKACLLVGLAVTGTGCAGLQEFAQAWDSVPRYGKNSRGEVVQVGGPIRQEAAQ